MMRAQPSRRPPWRLPLPAVFFSLNLALAGLLGACAIDSVPLPGVEQADGDGRAPDAGGDEPTDGTAAGADIIQIASIYNSSAPVRLVGTLGAMPAGSGVVRIEPVPGGAVTEGWLVRADINAAGSFYAILTEAAAGDTIRLTHEQSGVAGVSAELLLAEPGGAARGATIAPEADVEAAFAASAGGQAPAGDIVVGAPDAGGTVLVVGGIEALPAGVSIVVVDTVNGSATVAQAAADGSFAATVAAASGDTLELFAVDAAASRGGTVAVSVVVP